MDKVMVLLMVALLCCNFGRSSPLQGLVEPDSRQSASQRQQRVGELREGGGVTEPGDPTYFHVGEAVQEGGREGPRRRRLTATTTTAATTNQQPQPSRNTQRRAQQQVPEAEGKSAAAAAAGSVRTSTADEARGLLDDAPDGSVSREATTQVQTMDALEGQSQQTLEAGGTVEAVEGISAENDKGIKEGEAEGFVVVAGDDKSGEGTPGDSLDNDNGSTSGISNNIMVIVFCALAFVANGGFLVYVFWVM